MPMHLSVTRMNVAFKITGLALVAIGMQLIPLGQLFSSSVPHTWVSEARQTYSQAQGEDPDMGDREGVPPSSGSGSR
jgi:hypothetical protein